MSTAHPRPQTIRVRKPTPAGPLTAAAAPAPGGAARRNLGVASGHRRRALGLLAALVLLALVTLLSIAVGAKDIAPGTAWEALFAYSGTDEHIVIREMRLPRTVTGLAVGAALGLSGALIQALTRNPLADPGILGVNAGAAFCVVLGITLFGAASIRSYVWFAFAGALLVTIAVYLIGSAGRGPASPVRLTLAGVALGAVLSGITSGLVLLDADAFAEMRSWNAGSLAGKNLQLLLPVLPFLVVGALLALVAARPLNAIALGDDLAASLGTRVHRTRVLVVIAVTLLAGGATAIAGPIGFAGLMMPHIARWIVGPDQRWILPYTVVLTPVLLLTSDVLGRVLLRPAEIPVGVVTAFIGAPVLILLIRRRKASAL